MVHTLQLFIPALTPITDPVEASVRLTKGRLKQVTLLFPPGCVCLVGVWFLFHGVKVLPWNPEGVLFGDSTTLVFQLDYPIDNDPFDLIIQGYNSDDTYDHTVYITISDSPDEKERVATFSA